MLQTLRLFSASLAVGATISTTITVRQKSVAFVRTINAPMNVLVPSQFVTISDDHKTLEFAAGGSVNFPIVEDLGGEHDGLMISPIPLTGVITFSLTNHPLSGAAVTNVGASILIDIRPQSFRKG